MRPAGRTNRSAERLLGPKQSVWSEESLVWSGEQERRLHFHSGSQLMRTKGDTIKLSTKRGEGEERRSKPIVYFTSPQSESHSIDKKRKTRTA